jgi:filamentous hemagglutinin family protein
MKEAKNIFFIDKRHLNKGGLIDKKLINPIKQSISLFLSFLITSYNSINKYIRKLILSIYSFLIIPLNTIKKLISLFLSLSILTSNILFTIILTQAAMDVAIGLTNKLLPNNYQLSIVNYQFAHATNPDNYIQGDNASAEYSVQHPLNNIIDNPIPYIDIDNTVGRGETYLDRAQNGAPILNINRPTEQGVSANYYKDFNITEENLIFNNHRGEDVSTNLGGMIYGNPNFNKDNGKEATIILNEITTNRQTNLNGYVEIAGKKADLIIANPNGIMIGGGGFLNTAKLSLITGKSLDSNNSSFDTNGNLNPFQLSTNPNAIITVVSRNLTDDQGRAVAYNLGIDATDTDYLALISRIIEINGDIIGNDIELKTGNDKAYYNKKLKTDVNGNMETDENGNIIFEETNEGFEVTSDNNSTINCQLSTINCSKPEFAIDSTALGGIYGNKIKIIATEEGVGVRLRSDVVASVDDIDFDVHGNLIIKDANVYANGRTNIEAEAISSNGSQIISNDDLSIKVQSDYVTEGIVESVNGTTTIDAENITIDNNSETNLTGHNICLSAKGNIINKDNSILIATNNIMLNALNLYNSDNSIIKANNDIAINAGDNVYNGNGAIISANNNLTITAENKILNYGFLQAVGLGTGNLTLIAKAELNNDYRLNDTNDDGNSNNSEPKPFPPEAQDKLNNLNNITDPNELNELLTLALEANNEDIFYQIQRRIRQLSLEELIDDTKEKYAYDQDNFTLNNTVTVEDYNKETDQTTTQQITITEELVQEQLKDVLKDNYSESDWTIDLSQEEQQIDQSINEQQGRLDNYNQEQRQQKQQQYNQDKQTAQQSYEIEREYSR